MLPCGKLSAFTLSINVSLMSPFDMSSVSSKSTLVVVVPSLSLGLMRAKIGIVWNITCSSSFEMQHTMSTVVISSGF